MSKRGWRGWGSAALGLGGLILLTLSPTRSAAQGPSPVIIPGLPGAGLQAGTRPSANVWPYTDLPGGKAFAPPTEEEVARFAEMVKAGALTASQVGYLSLTVTTRKKAYDAFKKAFLPTLTSEEMAQFLEMAKDKKTGQYDLSGLPTFQQLTPAQRKIVYDAFKSQR